MVREIYTVRWHAGARTWYCNQLNVENTVKTVLIRQLARKLHRRWTFAHVRCQLRIFGKNGRIQSERTYGHDPRRSKG